MYYITSAGEKQVKILLISFNRIGQVSPIMINFKHFNIFGFKDAAATTANNFYKFVVVKVYKIDADAAINPMATWTR